MKYYTDRQKADFYKKKWDQVSNFNPLLFKIYWDLYKAYDMADKAQKRLQDYRKKYKN